MSAMLVFPLSSVAVILRMAFVFALVGWTVGQQTVAAPQCTLSTWNWTTNSRGQDPCQLAGLALTSCTTQNITIDPLQIDNSYDAPSSRSGDTGNLCKCNSVFYSLISACEGCQNGNWESYGLWTSNCTNVIPTGMWPSEQVGFPKGAAFPAWAFQQFNGTNLFNNITAFEFFQSNRSEITSLPGPPNSTSTSPAMSTSSHSHAGAIAGGVVGGVCGAALLAALGWWLLFRKRRRAASSLPEPVKDTDTDPSPPAFAGGPIYDPSNPLTFPDAPSNPTASVIFTTNSPSPSAHQPGHKPMSSWGGSGSDYRGLPEV